MKGKKILLPAASCGVILAFALILLFPFSREWFKALSSEHPFFMGFLKFSFLATAGEIIAGKVAKGSWEAPVKIGARFVIWGIIGLWITYMMKVFSNGVFTLMSAGILPGGENVFLKAFYTSATMNLSFGPTFMALHKCSDKYLELKSQKVKSDVSSVISGVDWTGFVKFTLFKTVPIFWIPAHTVTFMLPAEYQVIMAAALSVALGLILSLKK